MGYNIESAIDYLMELSGYDIRMSGTDDQEIDRLPLTLNGSYAYHDIEIFGTRLTLASLAENGDCSPIRLSKHQTKMTEVFSRPVVIVMDSVESYNLKRLTRARVNFIVPGKIVFIPSLLMVLKEVKAVAKELPEMMPPVAQFLLLYHLEVNRLDGKTTSEIAEVTGMAYPTINVALKWLVSKGLVALEGGKEKQVGMTLSDKELWEKASPLMSSPVEREAYCDEMIGDGLYSNETAMGHYTMLAEPSTKVLAISKASAKENSRLLSKRYGERRVEVWKYNPSLLSKGEYVDRLSLYLSMRESKDERVQMECDTLIEGMTW